MTTINTSNALGAKVLRHYPFNGTEGEIVGGSALTLGTAGSFVNDATHGWQLVGSGTGAAAITPSFNIPNKNNILCRFWVSVSSTQASHAIFATENWDGAGGGFLCLWDGDNITIGMSGYGRGVVYNFPAPTKDARHLFEVQLETYNGDSYVNFAVDRVGIAPTNRTAFDTSAAANTGVSTKPVSFLGWPGGSFSGKGYIEQFTVFDALTHEEKVALFANEEQIYGGAPAAAPTVAAPAIVGTPQVGVATSYTPGATTGSPAPTTTQQWTINGIDVAGATGATYTPVTADATKALRVRQIATNASGSVNSTSAPATVAAAGTPPADGPFNLTMSGATYGAGLFGQALIGGYGTVTPSPIPSDKTKDYFIHFRFKRSSAGGTNKNVIFSQAGVATVWIDASGNPQFSCAGGTTAMTAANLRDNAWHFGHLRFVGTAVELHIDGVGIWGINLNRVTNAGYNPTASPFVIGAEATGTNPFGGLIDAVSITEGMEAPSNVPEGPPNTKQPGLLAVYSFDGNGENTAGTAGVYPNGDLTVSELGGQRLVLSGTTYNGVTKGTAVLFPGGTIAERGIAQSVAMVISGTTWTATFENIAPGRYESKKMSFFNNANEGVSLTAPGFTIMEISGGGELEGDQVGAPITATMLTVGGASSGVVGVAQTITVGTDNPLTGSEVKAVSLSSPNGTFNPTNVTLNVNNQTATSAYTPNVAGEAEITVSAAGLTPAKKSFVATTPAVTVSQINLPLTTDGTTPAGYLADLQYAWFDEPLPQNFGTPKAKGSNGVINAGAFILNLQESALVSGQTGFLILTNTNGDPDQSPPALVFAGSVKVQ